MKRSNKRTRFKVQSPPARIRPEFKNRAPEARNIGLLNVEL
jgi:hypothetical protein